MVFAAKKTLPFIYSDTFIAIAIVIMVFLAVLSFVLVPLFILKKSPNRKVKLSLDEDNNLILTDELKKYFSKVEIKDRIVTFTRLPEIEKVKVALYFPGLISPKALIYDLDFNESNILKVAFPDHHNTLKYITLLDADNKDVDGLPVTSLKRSRLWIFSIVSGLSLAASIFLIVLILSTHLRQVDNSFVGYYFFALFGGALIPGIYFAVRAISKKLEKGGK